MTAKHFGIAKLVVAFIVAIAASQAVVANNYLPLAAAVAAGALVLFWMRSQVKEIVADERDFAIGGTAARWAIQIYAWATVIIMFALYSQREANPAFEAVASTLAYSTCFLMILYTIIFRYHQRLKFMAGKTAYLAIGIFIILITVIAGLRLFSGEDGWLCQNGQWVKHGQPSFPAPQAECSK